MYLEEILTNEIRICGIKTVPGVIDRAQLNDIKIHLIVADKLYPSFLAIPNLKSFLLSQKWISIISYDIDPFKPHFKKIILITNLNSVFATCN